MQLQATISGKIASVIIKACFLWDKRKNVNLDYRIKFMLKFNHQSISMNLKLHALFLLFFCAFASAQITGTITNTKGEPLPFVNILIENTYKGTTSNDDGYYELSISEEKTYTILYTYLGYKTVKKTVDVTSMPFNINVTLEEESVSLNEVVVAS